MEVSSGSCQFTRFLWGHAHRFKAPNELRRYVWAMMNYSILTQDAWHLWITIKWLHLDDIILQQIERENEHQNPRITNKLSQKWNVKCTILKYIHWDGRSAALVDATLLTVGYHFANSDARERYHFLYSCIRKIEIYLIDAWSLLTDTNTRAFRWHRETTISILKMQSNITVTS